VALRHERNIVAVGDLCYSWALVSDEWCCCLSQLRDADSIALRFDPSLPDS